MYGAADLAGVSRLQYTTEMRLIRVMCTGRVDIEFVLRAFANGVDGVFIGGCHLNECNYLTQGNRDALNMVSLCRKILEHVGLRPERLRIEFMSSGEGMRFAEVTNDFVREVKALGPLAKGEGIDEDELHSQLEAIIKLVPYIKIAKRDKLSQHPENAEDYSNLYTTEEIDKLFSEVVSYYIDPEKCQACGICLRKCPVEAISGGKNQIHVIDQEQCVKCGTCFEVCPPRFGAISKIVGEPVPPPIPEEARSIARKT